MVEFGNVAVPFITVGKRQCLAERQLCEMPWLVDFMNTFPSCFEYEPARQCYWFNPDGYEK